MANGTIHKLGTLYVNGTKEALPTKPWRTGSAPTGQSSAGNICDYGASSSKTVEIKDTDSDSAYQLQWVEVNDGEDQILICDRNILVNISRDRLNALGFCKAKGSGKTITIDGAEYELFMLTGGTTSSAETSNGANDEWNRYIANLGSFEGLPTPTSEDLDNSLATADYTSAHGGLWHWAGCYSWCRDFYDGTSSVVRGFSGARGWGWSYSYYDLDICGWRPALRVLNTAPSVSPKGKSFGVCTKAPAITLSITDTEGDSYNGVVKMDDVQKQTFSGTGTGNHVLQLSEWWPSLSFEEHTLSVTVTDSKGAATTEHYTFTKANAPSEPAEITNLQNGMRVEPEFYVEFYPGQDTEGDTQTMKVELADDDAFAVNKQEFSEMEKQENGDWVSASNVQAGDVGKKFRIKISGQTKGTKKYVRVTSNDAGSQSASISEEILVRIGTVLEIQTHPFVKEDRPEFVSVKLQAVIDEQAETEIFVCNNANDTVPTWEEYTKDSVHSFANQEKTADQWAVSVRVKVSAGAATEEISIAAIGMGVN